MTVDPVSRTFGPPPWSLAVEAMLSMQLSAAWSMGLIAEVDAAGTAWLRLTAGDLIFLTLARPPLRSVRCQDVPASRGGKTAVTVRQATIERGFATDT